MKTTDQLMIPDVAARAIRNCAVASYSHSIASAATTALTEVPIVTAFQNMTVSSVKYLPASSATPASGSNTQTLEVLRYDSAGANGVTVATCTLANATPAVQWAANSFVLSATVTLPQGYSLTVKSTPAGTCTLPIGKVIVNATIDGDTAI